MKGKMLVALSILLVLVMAVAGCGGGNNGTTAQSDNSASQASGDTGAADNTQVDGDIAAPPENVTLKLMHQWTEGGTPQQYHLVDQIISEFEKANPNIKIEKEVLNTEPYKSKLKVLSASNDLPDIGFTWAAGFMDPYVKGNMFAPLNDLVEGDLKGQFVKGTVEAYAFDGTDYALPVELNIVPVYYNKAIFAKYSLQVPKTYAEFQNVVKTLKDNGVTPITLGGKEGWTASFWYMYLADRIGGPDLMDQAVANNSFTDPALIEAAKQSQALVDMGAFNKGFVGLSNDEAKAEFMNGNAAMFMNGTWEVPNYTTNVEVPQEFRDNIGFFKFPTVDGGKGDVDDWIGGPGVALFVSNNSKHMEEAKKFVDFYVKRWGEVSVTDAGIIPATKVDTGAVKLPQMYIDLLNELSTAKKVTLYLDVQMKPVASEGHHNLVQALFGKQVTPEEFAQKQEQLLKDGK